MKTLAQRQLKRVAVEGFCSQLLPSVEVPKRIASTIIEDRTYHACEHTSRSMYAVEETFNI